MERFFVSRPMFAICIALAIVLLGAISIFDLSIEQYPDITQQSFHAKFIRAMYDAS